MHAKLPLALLLLVLCAGVAHAQVPFSLQDCVYDEVAKIDLDDLDARWRDLHPDSVYARLEPFMNRGEWGDVGAALAQAFRLSTTVPAGHTREALQAQLDALAAELQVAENEPAYLAVAKGPVLNRFDIDIDPLSDDVTLLPETPYEVDLNALDGAERRDVCWRAMAARRVLVRYGEPGRERAISSLNRMITLWDRYNENSYSQYPWELWINDLASGPLSVETLEDLAPPRTQIVFLHPGVALEAAGFDEGLDELRRLDVLMFEPVGILRYNDTRTSYLGASILVTVPADAGPGIGGLIHFGDRVQVGFVYRDADDTGRGSGLVLSVDVFKLLSGVPSALEQRTEELPALARPLLYENN